MQENTKVVILGIVKLSCWRKRLIVQLGLYNFLLSTGWPFKRHFCEPVNTSLRKVLSFIMLILDASTERLNVYNIQPFRSMIWSRSTARREKVSGVFAVPCPWKSTACRRSSMFTSPTRSTTGGWRSWKVHTWGTWPSWRECTSARTERGTSRKIMGDERKERPDCVSGWIYPIIL